MSDNGKAYELHKRIQEVRGLRQDLEQVQEQVAALESEARWLIAAGSKVTKTKILRKQAEAVELAANSNRLIEPHGDYCLYDDLIIDAQEIHQQADELEKADE